MTPPANPKYFTHFLMFQEHKESSSPTREEIAICAYLIWEQEGKPSGHLMEHWLQAETQLLACHAHSKWTDNAKNGMDSSK